jgi:hypothetical protein
VSAVWELELLALAAVWELLIHTYKKGVFCLDMDRSLRTWMVEILEGHLRCTCTYSKPPHCAGVLAARELAVAGGLVPSTASNSSTRTHVPQRMLCLTLALFSVQKVLQRMKNSRHVRRQVKPIRRCGGLWGTQRRKKRIGSMRTGNAHLASWPPCTREARSLSLSLSLVLWLSALFSVIITSDYSFGMALVLRLHDFCEERDSRRTFIEFYQSRCGVFVDLDDADDEQPLEAMEAFKEYEQLLEQDITDFLSAEEMEVQQFVEYCAKVQDDDDIEREDKMLLQIFLSALDYTGFVELMKTQASYNEEAKSAADDLGF